MITGLHVALAKNSLSTQQKPSHGPNFKASFHINGKTIKDVDLYKLPEDDVYEFAKKHVKKGPNAIKDLKEAMRNLLNTKTATQQETGFEIKDALKEAGHL